MADNVLLETEHAHMSSRDLEQYIEILLETDGELFAKIVLSKMLGLGVFVSKNAEGKTEFGASLCILDDDLQIRYMGTLEDRDDQPPTFKTLLESLHIPAHELWCVYDNEEGLLE